MRLSRLLLGGGTAALVVALAACSPNDDSDAAVSMPATSCAELTASEAPPQSTSRIDGSTTAANVILVTIDTWRYDAAGFAGTAGASTPTLDRMASSGLRFDRAHAHNVLTLPSHVNIHTGRLPYEHGVRDNSGFFLREEQLTLAERLQSAGYKNAAYVGAFPLDSSYGLDQGFDVYDDSFPKGDGVDFSMAERSGRDVVELGTAWWHANAAEKRFLWLHLYDPHTPYAPSPEGSRAAGGNAYLGEVADVDRYLSQLLDPLLQGSDAAAADTLIIVTGDHGEALGEHGEATHGLFAYDATLRVPLVVWGLGLEAEVSTEPASHQDIVPTVLAAAGLEADTSLVGRSLLTTLEQPRSTIYFEALNGTLLRGWAPLRGVIHSHFNTAESWSASKFVDLPIPELYDLDTDPKELNNLLPPQQALAECIGEELPTESQWPPQAGAVSEEERRALESLGYLSGGGPSNVPTEFGVGDDPKNLVELDDTLHRFIDAYRRGQLDRATTLARSMVEQRPQMGLGHYHLAQVLLESGRKREALRVLSDAYRAGTTTPSLIRQLGLSLADAGRHQEALRVLEPLTASGDLDTLLAYAQAQTESEQFEPARTTIRTVLERDADHPRAFETLALIAVRQSRWQEVLVQAQRALDLNPNLALPWNYLAIARYNLGQRTSALDGWKNSLRIDPQDYDVLYNYAIVSAEAGRRSDAESALQRFVQEAPDDPYAQDKVRARELLARMRQ